jgi:hypothetical protein
VRRTRAFIASAVLAVVAVTGYASAQTLQRLSVATLTLSADTDRPKVDVPFHLIVTAHVRERVADLENLDLPILAELELLGDERRVVSDRKGTTYRETIEVVAHHAGDIQIAPATLDVVDPRDGRPKRYFSNDLTLHIAATPAQTLHAVRSILGGILAFALRAVLVVAGVVCAVAIVVFLFRRRPRPVPLPDPPPVQQPVVLRNPQDVLRDALTTLRASPTRANVMRVRSVVRGMVGASETETLFDVLSRPQASDSRMRGLLVALERAAFTYDEDLSTAIDAVVRMLEQMTA